MSSWYRSSRSLIGSATVPPSWSEQLAYLGETFEQSVHVFERVVESEGCPHAGRHAKMVHHGHRAVMTRAHGDASLVEHCAHFVRMDAVDGERQDGGFFTGRAQQLQPRNFSRPTCRFVQKRVLVLGDRIKPDLADVIDRGAKADGTRDVGRSGL